MELTKEVIKTLPLIQFEGKATVVNTAKGVSEAVEVLSKSSVLGFDTETKPAFKKGQYYDPALIQLSTDKEAYIFQLRKVGFDPKIRSLLENKNIVKAGVSVTDDIKELNVLGTFEPHGFVDLAVMAKEREIPYYGLRNLAAYFLNGRISKSQQTSNWENDDLTESQIIYAATDAWVAWKIYHGMISHE